MSGDLDPFRAYHRARTWIALAKVAAVVLAGSTLAIGLGFLVAAAPEPESSIAPQAITERAQPFGAVTASGEASTDLVVDEAAAESIALPEPAPAATAQSETTAPPPTLAETGPRNWSIEIDTVGYQPEIDDCLWVRMDLGAAAPIVGAHNNCGGGVILEMNLNDIVVLSGTGLDGTFFVTDSRDARAGENAAQATAGLEAAVILQTCYWQNDGSLRLLALTPVG